MKTLNFKLHIHEDGTKIILVDDSEGNDAHFEQTDKGYLIIESYDQTLFYDIQVNDERILSIEAMLNIFF